MKSPGVADFAGNRQYITPGKLADNPKAFIFLTDYAGSRRIQFGGTARVVEFDPAQLESLRDPDDPGKVERAILFTQEAWDVKCPPQIHQRYSHRQITPVIEQLQARIRELEDPLPAIERPGPDA